MEADGRQATRLDAHRGDAACIAVLPKLMRIRRDGQALIVEPAPPVRGAALALGGIDGDVLLSQPARDGANRVDISRVKAQVRPLCVKLLSNGAMLDALPVPPSTVNPSMLN